MVHLSKDQYNAVLAKIKARAHKKLARRQQNAELSAISGHGGPRMTITGPASLNRPRASRAPKTKKLARRLAFDRLARLCRTFVMLRNKAVYGGRCEIAMACGGLGEANTWYHGWPQAGGNGLKYDVRAHFYSCGPCNMGEYGARMRKSDLYENRHKEILGPLWPILNALHGRRWIPTIEAVQIGDELERKISAGDWGRS